MPTRPRIDFAGYHHIINRGVNRCDVFNQDYDKDKFLAILNKTAIIYKVVLHDYVLMDNHYHLLIETTQENLSSFMRVVNANYAQYFNKKYKRSGHLWQDRYKSKYITSENYLYTLIRYIESNPIEAKLSLHVGEYPYTFSAAIFSLKNYYPCTNESVLIKDFDIKTLVEFLGKPMTDKEIDYLQKKQKEKIKVLDRTLHVGCEKLCEEHFYDVKTKLDRNFAIINAFLDGYTQANIALYLNLSKSLISKVIKSGDSTPGVY